MLFRQHASSGLGRCYSLYKELSDAWCNMSWAVYLVHLSRDEEAMFPLFVFIYLYNLLKLKIYAVGWEIKETLNNGTKMTAENLNSTNN